MTFYIAYGSNLNVAQMALRCPRAEPVGGMILLNHALVFRGVADIVRKQGAECPVGLWRITKKCEKALDVYEGVASKLYRKVWLTLDDGEEKRRCLVYQMNRGGSWPPSPGYFDTIREGYGDFELDAAPLVAALTASYMEREAA